MLLLEVSIAPEMEDVTHPQSPFRKEGQMTSAAQRAARKQSSTTGPHQVLSQPNRVASSKVMATVQGDLHHMIGSGGHLRCCLLIQAETVVRDHSIITPCHQVT